MITAKKYEDEDLAPYYFHQGTSTEVYRYLGCHLSHPVEGGFRYTFRTWAPGALAISVVGDHMGWDTGLAMHRVTKGGVWEAVLDTPDSWEGSLYKFAVASHAGLHYKGDPYAFFSEGGSGGASVICHPSSFVWEDAPFLAQRKQAQKAKDKHVLSVPMNIYEVHAASFARQADGSYLNYRELGEKLAAYATYMGYTHVEFMPLAEHPFDGSWGYQVCGFYAPTSRHGTPDDLRAMINTLHKAGLGVIMDWVPAHFPKDAWGLYEFDGAPLYEYQGKDRMESPAWGTRFFDLGREEIQSFLVSNALYWMREFHMDGLRVDAVASMLYLDYDRMPGEWIPNKYGDHRNLEAVAFLQKLNEAVDRDHPDVLMIAEESTAWGGVTKPVSEGGLGFDLKWNMGWANDFFHYLSVDPLFRRYHHTALNFPILYAYDERYILPVSHDEVVHGKRSLIGKISGSYEDKFVTFRTSLMFQMSFPGKKMLFMGTEFGQFSEWNYAGSLEWFMLEYPMHNMLREFVRALNQFYLQTPPLWKRDFSPEGFSWLLADEANGNLVAYQRQDEKGNTLLAVLSFSGASQQVSLEVEKSAYRVVFDATGQMSGALLPSTIEKEKHLLSFSLPRFGGVFLQPEDEVMRIVL